MSMQFSSFHVVVYVLALPRVRCVFRWRVKHRFCNAEELHVIQVLAKQCYLHDFRLPSTCSHVACIRDGFVERIPLIARHVIICVAELCWSTNSSRMGLCICSVVFVFFLFVFFFHYLVLLSLLLLMLLLFLLGFFFFLVFSF